MVQMDITTKSRQPGRFDDRRIGRAICATVVFLPVPRAFFSFELPAAPDREAPARIPSLSLFSMNARASVPWPFLLWDSVLERKGTRRITGIRHGNTRFSTFGRESCRRLLNVPAGH